MRVDDETKRASMQRVLSGDDGDVDGVVGEGKAGAGAGAGMTTYFYVSNIEDAVEVCFHVFFPLSLGRMEIRVVADGRGCRSGGE